MHYLHLFIDNHCLAHDANYPSIKDKGKILHKFSTQLISMPVSFETCISITCQWQRGVIVGPAIGQDISEADESCIVLFKNYVPTQCFMPDIKSRTKPGHVLKYTDTG